MRTRSWSAAPPLGGNRSGLSAVLLVAVFLAAAPSIEAHDHERVWVWNSRCQTPTRVALRVLLDGTAVYSTSLTLCQWEREFEKGKATFRFSPPRPLVWYGYRNDEGDGKPDSGDTTAAGTTLEIDFWQAGGEPDVIELGYTVAASDGLRMNSIHLLYPAERRTTTMAPGLVLETAPETKP